MARISPAAASLAALLFSGCLYTSHHFNSGRVLEPGHTAVTVGAGQAPLFDVKCPDRENYYPAWVDSGRCQYIKSSPEWMGPDTLVTDPNLTAISLPKFSLGYRLGVRGAWGPFTGVEMGWHMEAPTNPASVEFDLKLGLPSAFRKGTTGPRFAHSLSAGWSIGMWADNSYFLEYAASGTWREHSLYGNYRFTHLATQPADLERGLDQRRFVSHQRFTHQATTGLSLAMPAWILFPDFLSPQITVTAPVVPAFDPVPASVLDSFQWNVNLGVGWHFR